MRCSGHPTSPEQHPDMRTHGHGLSWLIPGSFLAHSSRNLGKADSRRWLQAEKQQCCDSQHKGQKGQKGHKGQKGYKGQCHCGWGTRILQSQRVHPKG